MTLIIFIKNRQTVVVRGSNFPIMILHILSMICLFTFAPLPYTLQESSKTVCYIELLVISLLVFSPYTLIFIKCQNLLLAFNSRLRLTTKIKKNALISQIMLVLILHFVNICLFSLTIDSNPLKLELQTQIYQHDYIAVIQIHTSLYKLFILIILLRLMSIIQAYRGRNLPGPFNEAMPIVYSSFTIIVTYMTYFQFQFLQRDKNIKIVARVLIITIANLLFVLIFYGSKLYYILLKTSKNTREYLQQQMFEISKLKVDSRINNKE